MSSRLPATSPGLMRGLGIVAVIAQAGIAVTGATVRVTGSGLGCPTWPECFPGSLVPTPHPEIAPLTQWIEFGNRLLTGVVGLVALACLLAALALRPRRRRLIALAAAQPVGVLAQAVIGGIVVRLELVWWSVGIHFMVSVVFVWLAVVLVDAAGEAPGPTPGSTATARRTVPGAVRGLVITSAVVLFGLVYAGTLVTAAGPHAGDAATPRLELGVPAMAQVHADLLFAYLGLLVGLGFTLRAVAAPGAVVRRYRMLLVVVLAQGALGGLQYALGVPELLVALHVLGSMLVVAAAAAVWASTTDRTGSAAADKTVGATTSGADPSDDSPPDAPPSDTSSSGDSPPDARRPRDGRTPTSQRRPALNG